MGWTYPKERERHLGLPCPAVWEREKKVKWEREKKREVRPHGKRRGVLPDVYQKRAMYLEGWSFSSTTVI